MGVCAVGIAAEIGDFTRFAKASLLMAYVGLVPSESSNGPSRRQGGITKTGNRHVRRLLIEAGWHDFHGPTMVKKNLLRRREGVPAEVIAIADRVLRRLHGKCHKLQLKQKPSTKIVVGLARELSGFVWSAGRVPLP